MFVVTKEMLKKISDVIWEIPKETRSDMLVPARIYATEKMLDEVFNDRTLNQLINVSTLQGIVGYAHAMPDAHEGYGFPIGGVAATAYPDGVISPGGIGYDINCGVRLLKSNLKFDDVKDHLEELSKKLYHWIPSGVGKGGRLKLTENKLNEVLQHGAKWIVQKGYGLPEDPRYMESGGCLENADPSKVSQRAKQRGLDQIGTLGAGNHFVEVDVVDKIFHEQAGKAFGLEEGQIVILIHTGSRGLGHQIATDYIKIMMKAMQTYGIKLPDRELACVPFSSPEGSDYFAAMSCGANYAWTNRQMITWEIRQAWAEVFGKSGGDLSILYDVAHNMAKIETHEINGKQQKVIMHRKGATRAFGPGHPDITEEYRAIGQPVLIPGSMGTASYVLVGTEAGMNIAFGSSCHGAGRRMSRRAAKKLVDSHQLHEELLQKGIHVQAGSLKGLAEESPAAYKDIDEVVRVVHEANLAHTVARLKPLAVIKG